MVFRTIGCLWLASFGITSTLLAQTGGAWNKAFSAAAAQGFADAHGYAGVGFAPALISIPGKPFTATRTYTDKRKDADGVHEFPPLSADFTIARDDKGRIHYEMAFEQVRNGKLVIGGF